MNYRILRLDKSGKEEKSIFPLSLFKASELFLIIKHKKRKIIIIIKS